MNIQTIEANYKKHNIARCDSDYFLGSICGIWDKNGLVWSSSEGYADLEKTKPLNGNSVFRMASMTKPVSACAFMQMVEKGLIGLDTPISRYLPMYENMKVATKIENGEIVSTEDARFQITPRMLLTHSSGVGCGETYMIQIESNGKMETLEKSVENYAGTVLEFQPGTTELYSGIWGFDICARLVEILSGMPYEVYVQKHIFEPLGMKDTTYLPNEEQISRTVVFAGKTEQGIQKTFIRPKAGHAGFGDGWVGGGAGLFSTLDDYSRFARMLLGGGELEGVRILEESTVALMSQNQKLYPLEGGEKQSPWGLGMRVLVEQNAEQPLPKGSFGWSGAFGTHFWIDKEHGITCVYLMNLSTALGSGEPAAAEFERDVMSGF